MINLHELHSQNIPFDKHYKLKRHIGGGAFSEVWLANDIRSQVDVAIKVYASQGELDDEGIKMFRKEFTLVCNLNHTNILKPFTFDIVEGAPYIVMPFCEKGSASKLIGKATEAEIWNFASQVADGLAYLHSHQIIHQDIKPLNILINSDNQYLITDFGISTGLRNTIRRSTKANESANSGTTHYMSFECFGAKPQNVIARDIWAFGAMMFEIMTGDVPFGEYGGLTQNAANGTVPKIEGNYSSNLKTLVSKCLAFNPWDRPSAEEIQEMISNHQHGIELNFGKENDTKATQLKHWLSVVAGIVSVVIATFCGAKYYGNNTKTDRHNTIATTSNVNDSIVFTKVEEANNIVDNEKKKNNIKNIDENRLQQAAEIYTEAVGMNASDSVISQCKEKWNTSQQVIDKSYKYLYNKGVEYSKIGATSAANEYGKKSLKLKKYISEQCRSQIWNGE